MSPNLNHIRLISYQIMLLSFYRKIKIVNSIKLKDKISLFLNRGLKL